MALSGSSTTKEIFMEDLFPFAENQENVNFVANKILHKTVEVKTLQSNLVEPNYQSD